MFVGHEPTQGSASFPDETMIVKVGRNTWYIPSLSGWAVFFSASIWQQVVYVGCDKLVFALDKTRKFLKNWIIYRVSEIEDF